MARATPTILPILLISIVILLSGFCTAASEESIISPNLTAEAETPQPEKQRGRPSGKKPLAPEDQEILDSLSDEEKLEILEREKNRGWTKDERNLCFTESTPSPEPCFLIWLNPLTFVRTEVLSRLPTILYFHRLIPTNLAAKVVAKANATDDFTEMHPFDTETGEEHTNSDERIMDATYIEESENELVHQMFTIVRDLVGVKSIAIDNNLELFRYKPGGHFSRHFDNDVRTDEEKWLSTMLVYFKVPKDCNCGTAFPELNINANPKDVGDAIYFYNIHANWRSMELMEHSGCPVQGGEKWSAWIGFKAHDDDIGATCSTYSSRHMDLWHRLPPMSEKRRYKLYSQHLDPSKDEKGDLEPDDDDFTQSYPGAAGGDEEEDDDDDDDEDDDDDDFEDVEDGEDEFESEEDEFLTLLDAAAADIISNQKPDLQV